MISKKMETAINDQINAELYSAYLYMAMSAYCESINLTGFAHWMETQALEEFMHAKKFYAHLVERGGRIRLAAIDGPPSDWKSIEEVFEETAAHEAKVTALINNLTDMAIEEKDHASNAMLQWFISEQVEEESTAQGILENIRLAGAKGSGIFMIDREVSQRVFNAAEYTGGE